MTRTAIYARKSTKQDRAEDEKSVAEQERTCRAFISKSGWTPPTDAHVYVDNAKSGPLFTAQGRPQFFKMVHAAGRRAFDVLVVYNEDRFGRDRIRGDFYALEIIENDVRIFYADDGTERKMGSNDERMLGALKGHVAEGTRERNSNHQRITMRSKARRGEATGTTPFGYQSGQVGAHKELVVDKERAEIVRQIFEKSAQGLGITRIAHWLNSDEATKGLRKWSAPGVRNMLNNSIYVGQVVYGKKRVQMKHGKKIKVTAPDSEWTKVPRPELQIVPDKLWAEVQARKEQIFASYLRGRTARVCADGKTRSGLLQGRPESRVSEYLLTGFVVCGVCGGRLVIWSRKAKTTTYRYMCCWRHKSGGNAACTNQRAVPVVALTEAIVEHFREDVLTTERIEQVVRDIEADAEANPEKVAAKRQAIQTELRRLESRLAKLADAVAEGGSVKTLVDEIKKTEVDQRAVQARLDQLEATQQAVAQWSNEPEKFKLLLTVAEWQKSLENTPVVGRQILRKLLTSPITVKPMADGSFEYTAEGSYSRLIQGVIGGPEPHGSIVRKAGAPGDYDLGQELRGPGRGEDAGDAPTGACGARAAPAPRSRRLQEVGHFLVPSVRQKP